ELPFEALVEELGPERDLSRTPLFQFAFALHGAREAGLALDGLDVRPYAVDTGTARYDLELRLAEDPGGGLSGTLTYDTDLFQAATARRRCEHLSRLLEACARHPDRPLWTLPLAGPAELASLDSWNRTAASHPGGCVHELFEAQVERTPEAV